MIAAIRIEYDREADAVYVDVAEGLHDRIVEVEPLTLYIDVDAEGRTLGIEFLGLTAFRRCTEDPGGLTIPERFTGPQSLAPA